ncbi:MAG: NAD(P)-dependent oxidoreductase [Brevundimonas sp.]|jgi:3-hydroxyisobutyrate dehydrogenase-like beta-hydroxyacid dehydrogenase|uniref:NAD(P)-dependent oxidoreductase n=1 Tax=Brevundimonas sp. TaxID=1871086 RepID=UPI0025BE2560|nr:NAD(P)-dependent oxidoreductase [Brevundimonas sp.]MCH4269511.1 NAD(P)-dependent oxidoreductase [Brevundimonas sp.]
MTDAIGMIGLGNMGGHIATGLLEAGFGCVIHDASHARMEALVARGAVAAASPKAVADLCPIVMSCLPSPEISRVVACGEAGAAKGSAIVCYVEMSTIGLVAAREIAADLERNGIAFIDAPISGGPAAAEARTLTAMMSGSETAIDAVQAVMKAFCQTIYRVGGLPGQAQACKLVNNAISLTILALASEAAVFGVAAGLDADVMIDVVNSSSGRSAVTETKFPKHILKRRFDFGAALSIGEKDLKLFVEEARKLGSPTEITPVAARIWEAAGATSDPGQDMMTLIEWFERPLGVVVGRPRP